MIVHLLPLYPFVCVRAYFIGPPGFGLPLFRPSGSFLLFVCVFQLTPLYCADLFVCLRVFIKSQASWPPLSHSHAFCSP
jgi:hypothetical protein